jgi:hypothetical protein
LHFDFDNRRGDGSLGVLAAVAAGIALLRWRRIIQVIQHMAETVLRKIVDPTGKHRVLILQRANGSYGWEVEQWSDEPLEQCWIRPEQYPFSICGSEEIALREALGRVEWLAAATESAR